MNLNTPSGKHQRSKNHCYIHVPPLSNPNQRTHNIHVNYAKPDDIERFSFQPARGVFIAVEHFLPQIFNTFPNLKQLAISRSLDELNSNDFTSALNLNTIWMTANKLAVIRNDIFSPATKMSPDLHPNGISKAADVTVFPLHKLIDLALARNEISEIEDHSFYGLNALLDLDLPHNRLTVIHRMTFAGLPSLRNLNLDHNLIDTIEDGAFDLPALMGLFLSQNKLKRLSDAIFHPLRKVVAIKVDDNDLGFIGRSLSGIRTLQTISLKRNRIQDIDLTILAELPNLIEASLTRSGFTFDTTRIENGQRWNASLTELEIDENDLTDETELEKLRIFPHLEVLNLNGNLYTDFEIRGPKTVTDILPALSLLYLRATEIDCIDVTSLARELKAKNVDVIHDCMF